MIQSRTRPQKPLVEIKKPLKARAYRARFRALETTKFLDVKALKRAKHVTIEVGTLEFAGMSQAIAAEIRNGMVVALKPVACKGCDTSDSKKKPGKIGDALKRTVQLVGAALREGGNAPTPLPMPIKVSARSGFEIQFGPIVVVVREPFDICVAILIDDTICVWCLLGESGCLDIVIGPGGPA